MRKRGFTVLELSITLVITMGIVAVSYTLLKSSLNFNTSIAKGDELQALRSEAQRVDCAKSLATSPCGARDKYGNVWPNATGTFGTLMVSSSCSTSGVSIVQKATSAPTTDPWLPLFPDRPFFCEPVSAATGGPITPTVPTTPYYQIIPATMGAGCYGSCWGGDDNRNYCLKSVAANCPAGYIAIGGGASCGSDASTAGWSGGGWGGYTGPAGLVTSFMSGGVQYYGFQASCCMLGSAPITLRAICIRSKG